jgi:hypothetical protein
LSLAYASGHSYGNCDFHTYPGGITNTCNHRYAYAGGITDANTNSYCHSYNGGIADACAYSYCHGYCYSNSKRDTDTNTYTYRPGDCPNKPGRACVQR